MPNLYTRATALQDVLGRLDYIESDQRQENMLAFYDGAAGLIDGRFWEQLAKESQAAYDQFGSDKRVITDRRTGEKKEVDLKCCQGRELVIMISNSLREDKKMSDQEIVQKAVQAVSDAIGQPVAGALHYNRAKSNLHLHLILPERELLKEPVVKIAERNLFFDAQGKRRYKKSEILDENKQLLPGCRIVKKGEVYEERYFGSVDTKYSSKAWMKQLKTKTILALLNGDLRGDVEITEFDPSTGKLPQQHVGNKAKNSKEQRSAPRIQEYNRMVRRWNWLIDHGKIDHDFAMETQKKILASRYRNDPLKESLDQLEEAILKAEAERKKQALERENWSRYRSIRDESWQIYIDAQRVEMAAIRALRAERRQLFEEHSRPVYLGNVICRKLDPPAALEAGGYFRRKEEIEGALMEHQEYLGAIRECEAISRARQRIVRGLILAGAEQSVIDSAIREYEEATKLLQIYVQDPGSDFQGRRLKMAKDSLKRAQMRAERHIAKLTEEQKDAPEECELMDQAEAEYQAFKASDKEMADALAKDEAAAGLKPALSDRISDAESRQGSGVSTGKEQTQEH